MRKEDLENNDEVVTVTLTLDDDSEIECDVITILTAGKRDYIALLPTEGPDAGKGTVYLYRYIEVRGEEPTLENIEDDEEYELASDAFDEYLDSAEFDELMSDGEDL